MEELTTIQALRKQEDKCYCIRGDYLCSRRCDFNGNLIPIVIDKVNRESMLEWSYKVIDFLGFDNETVEIATNYFDRYLLTPTGSKALSCTKQFQLASMACLYLSIKIHEEVVLDSLFMANLSNGLFTYREVEQMELQVLTALQWYVNPPSALAFIREYLKLLPPSVSQNMTEKAYTLCEPQIQLAVMDYNFINIPASTVALFALMNSLKVLGMEPVLWSHVGSLLSYASHIINLESIRPDIQAKMYETIMDFSLSSSSSSPTLSPSSSMTPISCGETSASGSVTTIANDSINMNCTETGISCGFTISLAQHQQGKMHERLVFNESPCGVFSS